MFDSQSDSSNSINKQQKNMHSGRLHERWPGKIQSLCFGHFIISKDVTRVLPMTFMAMILPLLMFSLFQWPTLYQYFSNDQTQVGNKVLINGLLVLGWLLVACMMWLACSIVLTDPGIYPHRCIVEQSSDGDDSVGDNDDDSTITNQDRVMMKGDDDEDEGNSDRHERVENVRGEDFDHAHDDVVDMGDVDVDVNVNDRDDTDDEPLLDHFNQSVTLTELGRDHDGKRDESNDHERTETIDETMTQTPPLFQFMLVNGHETRFKYCTACQLYRPLTVSHCKKCNHCVEGFDHHCMFLGQCIGRRNHGTFYQFIVLTFVSLVLYIAVCVSHLVIVGLTSNIPIARKLHRILLSSILLFYSIGACLFVGALVLLHSYLLITGQTTAQVAKRYRFPHLYQCEQRISEQKEPKNPLFLILKTLLCGHLMFLFFPRRVCFRTSIDRKSVV